MELLFMMFVYVISVFFYWSMIVLFYKDMKYSDPSITDFIVMFIPVFNVVIAIFIFGLLVTDWIDGAIGKKFIKKIFLKK